VISTKQPGEMHSNRMALAVFVPGAYDTIRYDRWFALENWQASCQFNPAYKLKKTKNVLNGTKKVRNKNQETDGYERDETLDRKTETGRK